MKLSRLNNPRFQVALTKLISQPVPLRTAFKLKGILATVQTETRKFDEVRQAALHRFGSKDDTGKLLMHEDGTVQFEQENLRAFVQELNELGETEIALDCVSITELGDNTNLTAEDIIALDQLVID